MASGQKETKQLRHGYTTGSNATAATKAALLSLITQKAVNEATIKLPNKEIVTFQMESVQFTEQYAEAAIIKDGGDDPDATHGARIVSRVAWESAPGIKLDGGVGVGRVTKPGLPVAVGEAAINPVPRRMLFEVAEDVLEETGVERGISIIISVPDGEEIAKKTLNSRLGIIGGISILGTRGTVVPFSTSAFRASIAQALQVAKESGCEHVICSTGGRSEKYAMELFPDAPEEAFIEMGDFVGFTLKQCKAKRMKQVTLVGMMGKFSKVAQGVMMVHSKSAPVSFEFLAKVAVESGVPPELQQEILQANTASQVGTMLDEAGYADFFQRLCRYASEAGLQEVNGGLTIETILLTMKNELLGREAVRWPRQ
ncbi:cobalt-precorrin-5B (C(1))-methyltransferase [Halalkalibacter oceani]|uniref:cobalt-precorrin-5B (C(1))-methyltransferase n=1 Tax=Halalkalibacter oceani TaxID=1653776 RepID=UPI0033966A26